MSRVEAFTCDVCGIMKQDANHWWKVYVVFDGEDRNQAGLLIVPWTIETIVASRSRRESLALPREPDAHLCGEQHLLEWVSKHLTAKIEERRTSE